MIDWLVAVEAMAVVRSEDGEQDKTLAKLENGRLCKYPESVWY